MHMDEIGYNHKHDETFRIDRPRGAGDWLCLIIKTKAIFRINGEDLHIPANSFIFFTPEYPQYYGADHAEYIDDWIHFWPDQSEITLMEQLRIPFNQVVSVSDTSHISHLVKYMCYEQYSSNKYRHESVDLHFRLMLYKMGEYLATPKKSQALGESPYVEQLLWLRESIYRWPARDWGVDDMAAALSLSRSRLQHLYTMTFGVSITKDILAARLERALNLLCDTDMSIAEIAVTAGYGNASYFNRQFRAAMGKTPTQFRQEEQREHH